MRFYTYIRRMHFITTSGLIATFLLLLLTLSILIPINLKSEKTIAASGDTSTTSLTLSTTSGSAELDLLVTSDSGTFASSTTPLSFSASTNNYTGYTLSIKSATNSTNLTNDYTDGNNNSTSATFASLSSTNTTTKNGITAVTFNSSTYNNQWGFKPSYYNSTVNSDKFYPSPDSTGVTLNRTNCANGSSNGTYNCPNSSDSYAISIGARATYAQVAGTYTNKYILSAVGNYPQYEITYNDASGESTDLPTTQEISSLDNETAKQTSINFSTTEPTRDGYEFIGWCSVDNSSDPTSCSGTTYDPGDTYALDLLSSNTMPLYAIWKKSKVLLYDAVAAMSKGTFGYSTINDALTTENSGVYRYNKDTYGLSDDSDEKEVYFYRGIIDSSFSDTYGSSGDGALYPNYVKLTTGSNVTCWRIFRTTGSGGVKMLYNGIWNGSTCANATTDAQLSSTAYYNRASIYASTPSCSSSNFCGTTGFATYVGYNYNSSYAYNNTGNTTAIDNSTLFDNSTASNIRTQVENWYSTTIGTSNNGLFETNAGYCNDRTTYSGTAPNTVTTTTVPYKTSGAAIYFGAYIRIITARAPSLACPNTTNLDLLNDTIGKSYPVALITADEAVLAGHGESNTGTYSQTSYLTSGSYFWSLSPADRLSMNGNPLVFGVRWTGALLAGGLRDANGVRPAISLAPGTAIHSGSGTATDPWVVQPTIASVTYMQDVTADMVSQIPEGATATLLDRRDNSDYTVKKINGQLWMTQNLRFRGTSLNSTTSNIPSIYTESSPLNIAYYELSGAESTQTDGHCYGNGASGNGHQYACIHNSGNTTTGVWYNYAAATALSEPSSENPNLTAYDLCPANWHLPTGPANDSSTQFHKLFNSTSTGWIAANSYLTAFNAVAGGVYNNGDLLVPTYGYWWSSTAYDATSKYLLGYNSDNNQFYGYISGAAYYGYFVRCLFGD